MKSEQAHTLTYRAVRVVVRAYLRLFHRYTIEGAEHIPATGGCIVAANHGSYMDPPIICCASRKRAFHFMARKTLWEHSRFSRWFFSAFNCIPVDRNRGDISALRKAIHIVRSGSSLALFPEGTRSSDGRLQPAEAGLGFLIAKCRAPVVPAYIHGSFNALPPNARFIRPVRVGIRFGPAIPPDQLPTMSEARPDFGRISEFVMQHIAELRPASPLMNDARPGRVGSEPALHGNSKD